MVKPLRVFLVGASGTGKSTLAERIAKEHGISIVPSVGRELFAEMGGADVVDANQELRNKYQMVRFERQVSRILTSVVIGEDFVSDRSIDTLAYTAIEATNLAEVLKWQSINCLVDPMRESVVLFIRPVLEVIEAALKNTGDRPSKYLNLVYVYRIDGIVKYLLEAYAIPHVQITTGNWDKRWEQVSTMLNEFKQGKGKELCQQESR